ncbi:hypothetical protein ES703_102812 [subsurface metagenome]
MVHLANKAQPVRVGVVYPRGVYSRVILVQLIVASGIGNYDFAVTPPLGNRVWLLGVDIWHQPTTQGGFVKSYLKITTGSGETFTRYMVSMDWASVMDTTMLMKVGMLIFCCDLHLHFTMNKLYSGESQRFGIYSESNSNQQYSIIGAFHVSEG